MNKSDKRVYYKCYERYIWESWRIQTKLVIWWITLETITRVKLSIVERDHQGRLYKGKEHFWRTGNRKTLNIKMDQKLENIAYAIVLMICKFFLILFFSRSYKTKNEKLNVSGKAKVFYPFTVLNVKQKFVMKWVWQVV